MKRGRITKRPWGRFTTYIMNSNGVTVKTIVIDPGQRLSLQYHSKRSERWICLEGEATVKRFFRENGRVRLQPENRTMRPIFSDDVSVVGRVEAVVRRL